MENTPIRYCPICHKAVTTTNGHRKDKKCYICYECNRQFVDKKYPTEIQELAVAIREKGCSYRKVARIFKISPNTVRNWEKGGRGQCDNAQLELLEVYWKNNKTIKKLRCKKDELTKKLDDTRKYYKLKEQEKDVYRRLNNTSMDSPNHSLLWEAYAKVSGELLGLVEPQKNETVKVIENQVAKVKNKINNLIEQNKKIKSQNEYVRKILNWFANNKNSRLNGC